MERTSNALRLGVRMLIQPNDLAIALATGCESQRGWCSPPRGYTRRRRLYVVARGFAAACIWFVVGRAAVAAPVEYAVHVAPSQSQVALEVSVCLSGAARVRRFRTYDESTAEDLSAPTRSTGLPIDRQGTRLRANHWRAGECLRYRVDADAIAAKGEMDVGYRVGDDRLISASAWLWRPDVPPDVAAEITFDLPDGWSLSTPWHALDEESPRRHFLVGGTPADWPTLVAIGRFSEESIAAGEGHVQIDFLGNLRGQPASKLRRYVTAGLNDVVGDFPKVFAHGLQLIVVPVGKEDEAVPFGMSVRGGGNAIWLRVDPAHAAKDFDRDWTLTHEFVHVIHPDLGPDGRWIAEGIATYYQNVLRARSGRISAEEAWKELDSGFERGRADHPNLAPRAASTRMEQEQCQMRVYWSGTALMLLADVALRTRAKNPTSLDAALDEFIKYRSRTTYSLQPAAFLAALDHEIGGQTLQRLYRTHVDRAEFPDVSPAYRELGLGHDDGRLTLSGGSGATALRAAIMHDRHAR